MVNTNKTSRHYSRFKTPGEAEVYELEAVNYLLLYMGAQENEFIVFQRQRFEQHLDSFGKKII